MKPEVDSLKFDRRKQDVYRMFTERSELVMLITCWYVCFPALPASAFLSSLGCFYADPLHNQPSDSTQSISRNADRLRNSLLIRGIYLAVTVVLC